MSWHMLRTYLVHKMKICTLFAITVYSTISMLSGLAGDMLTGVNIFILRFSNIFVHLYT